MSFPVTPFFGQTRKLLNSLFKKACFTFNQISSYLRVRPYPDKGGVEVAIEAAATLAADAG